MAKKSLIGPGLSKQLREFGLKYPGAHTKSPWPGHLDLAVKNKTFAYLSPDNDDFGISCKLPFSAAAALMFPFSSPTEYGLGKSGWVSARFHEGDKIPPLDLFRAWIDESYRAQAPKKLVKDLPAPGALPAAPAKKKVAPVKKASKKKARAR
jgi:predicted DNA-binding protein (MmcQ/YjbR family)